MLKKSFSVNSGSLVKSTSAGVLISVLVSLGSFLFNILAARNMNVSTFALFVSVMTFINLVGIVFSGFQVSAAREIAQGKTVSPVKKLDGFTTSILAISVCFGIFLWATQSVWNSGFGLSETVIVLLAIVFPSSAILIVVNGRLAGLGRFKEQSIVSLVLVFINLGIQLLLVALYGMNLERTLMIQLGINLAIGFVLILWTNKNSSVSVWAFSSKSIQTALIVAIFGFLINFDILFSPSVLSMEDRGQYSAASSFAKYLIIFWGMVNATLFTMLNRNKAAGIASMRILKISGLILVGLSICFVLGTYFIVRPFFPIVYGQHFSIAANLVPFVALCAIPFVAVSWILQFVYMRISWAAVFIAAILGVTTTACLFTFVGKAFDLAILYLVSGTVSFLSFGIYLLIHRRERN